MKIQMRQIFLPFFFVKMQAHHSLFLDLGAPPPSLPPSFKLEKKYLFRPLNLENYLSTPS